MKKKTPPAEILGCWRITEMDNWDQDFVELKGEAFFEFQRDGNGEFQFGSILGRMDCRFAEEDGSLFVEFSWQGSDESIIANGRGWAVLEDEELIGHIFIHNSKESAFAAERSRSGSRHGEHS